MTNSIFEGEIMKTLYEQYRPQTFDEVVGPDTFNLDS